MQNRAVVSLAILSVNFAHSKSYLDNFVPLLGECLRLGDEDVVSLPVVQQRMQSEFGLTIPQNVLQSVLRRAQSRGYIAFANGVYYRVIDVLEKSNFRDVQQQVLRSHDELIRSLADFAADRFSLTWTRDDAEVALQDHVEDNEVAILAGARGRIIVPDNAQTPHSRFVVARFLQHLQEEHSGYFDYFETIVKGSMLASAVFLPDPEQASARFARGSEIFFDTAFLIFALGYGGDARKEPARELLHLLRDTGASLRCFRHTLDEIHGALEACANALSSKNLAGPIRQSVEYFIQLRADKADVLRYAARLEQDLESLYIQVVDTPPYANYQFVIDEAALNDEIDEQFTYRPTARERDVASVAAIVRLRKGEPYYLIEKCKALFVTTNAKLARVARDFVARDLGEVSLAPCITDHALTTVLWLKKPVAAPDLPRKRIIADCFAATQPSEQMVRKYLEKVDTLEAEGKHSENECFLLRYSMEARNALMDRTLGEEEAFTQGTIAEVLDVVKESIVGEEREKFQEASAALADAKRLDFERSVRVRNRAIRIAGRVGLAARVAVLVLLVLAAALLFTESIPGLNQGIFSLVAGFVAVALFVLSAIDLVWGNNVERLVTAGEDSLARRIESLFSGD